MSNKLKKKKEHKSSKDIVVASVSKKGIDWTVWIQWGLSIAIPIIWEVITKMCS